MAENHDTLRDAAPAYDDVEARRARAGVAAALFGGGSVSEKPAERVAVGRYEIESRLGAGGMGVVYRAHDPDLDRPVAVKLLHTDSSTDEKARARMLREARALAKLSHPNVITVYDVGTDDGRVFVAMELVAGRDLRRWLEQHRDASWRQILALFIAAGRGLAAAHEVALVHRDFKPENVLVGDDARVRVLDFGLARIHRPLESTSAAEGPPPASLARTDGDEGPTASESDRETERSEGPTRWREDQSASESDRETERSEGPTRWREDQSASESDLTSPSIAHLPTSAFSGGLTETGAMLGTPLYMAPEVYKGRAADERSDQFAFCASLYEGLYRQLPFGERTLMAHVDAVAAGRVVEPPEDSSVPVSLWRIVARGLSPDPLARHPDMRSLLDALDRVAAEPPPTELPSGGSSRRLVAIAGGVSLAVVGLIGLELGWFGGGADAAQVQVVDPELEVESDELARVEAAVVDPLVVIPVADPIAEPQLETGSESESETEAGLVALDTDAPPPEPELDGWCHLLEDHLTLLLRTDSRRGRFVSKGQCYECRVERRRSRWRSFSPRDCAGYSLCFPAAEEECQ